MPRVKVRQEKNDAVEEEIRRALEKRDREGTSFQDLAFEFGVPRLTLNDRARGGISRWKAHEEEQALPPAIEDALEKWAQKMDDHGFPPRLDIFKAMAQELAVQNAEQTGDPTHANIGQGWLSSFLNHHPKVSSKFGSNLDHQRALAGSPGLQGLGSGTPKARRHGCGVGGGSSARGTGRRRDGAQGTGRRRIGTRSAGRRQNGTRRAGRRRNGTRRQDGRRRRHATGLNESNGILATEVA